MISGQNETRDVDSTFKDTNRYVILMYRYTQTAQNFVIPTQTTLNHSKYSRYIIENMSIVYDNRRNKI